MIKKMIASTFMIIFIHSSTKVEPLLTNTSVKRTPRVCSCLCLLPFFDFTTHAYYWSHLRCPSYRVDCISYILSHNIRKIKRTMVSHVRPIIRATCEHKNASRWVICNLPQNLFIFRSSFHCCAILYLGIFFGQEGKSYKIVIGATFVYRLLHESL